MRASRAVVVLLVVLLLATPVLAHVPSFPTDNSSPDGAIRVPNPTKSWVFYDSLGAGQVAYYRVTLEPGERLHVGTFTPVSGGFTPSIVAMSPSLPKTGTVPRAVSAPENAGAVVVEGTRSNPASYEPFTPSAIYQTARLDRRVGSRTTYLIAIYEPANGTGPVGVTIGTEESFSVAEFAVVPFDLVRIHLWEGQPLSVALGPFALTVLAGFVFVRRRWRAGWAFESARASQSVAGLLIAGSGLNTAAQMGIALAKTGLTPGAFVTAAFALVPIVIGGLVVRRAVRDDFAFTTRLRVSLAVAGGLALLTWAGFVAGPAILVGLAAVPSRALE